MNPYHYVGLGSIDRYMARLSIFRVDVGYTDKLMSAIEHSFGVNEIAMKGKGKTSFVSEARHAFCHLARKHTDLPLAVIGGAINRHHSTVMNSIKVSQDLCDIDRTFRSKFDEAQKIFLSK